MKILQFIRFGSNFNYRFTIGIQWPVYFREYPFRKELQRKPGSWKMKLFPKEY